MRVCAHEREGAREQRFQSADRVFIHRFRSVRTSEQGRPSRHRGVSFTLFGQNEFAQLGGLELVEATVVQDVYGFLSLQEAPAVQQGSTGQWMVGMLREELLVGYGGLSAS